MPSWPARRGPPQDVRGAGLVRAPAAGPPAGPFDAYGVGLVLTGHEHHCERTFPVRGTRPGSSLLTPAPQGSDRAEIDARQGAVHLVIGGGGHPEPTPRERFGRRPTGVVIADVGPGCPSRPRWPVPADPGRTRGLRAE